MMKTLHSILPLAIFMFGTMVASAQHVIPLTPEYWEIEDGENKRSDLDLTTLYGMDCLHLPGGNVAWLKDSSFSNFRLEMDMAGIYMPGLSFRGFDKRNYEHLYLRVLSNNQQDALQYLPVFNGGFSWQLYNYPDHEAKVSYPKKYLCSLNGQMNEEASSEDRNKQIRAYLRTGGISTSDKVVVMQAGPGLWKIIDPGNLTLHYMEQADDSIRIYSGLEWIHVRLEVFGKMARFYVEDMKSPVIVINRLKQEEVGGMISLRNVFLESYYANIRIEPIDHMAGYRAPDPTDPAVDLLSQYELSGKFGRDVDHLQDIIDSVVAQTDQWRVIRAEPDGLINLSRYFDITEGTALLKTTIESPTDQLVDLHFDYTERLAISLNSEIVFSDSLRVRNNEGRVVDGEEKTELRLVKGTNELIFMLTSDAYRQNWGMVARIPGFTFP